MTHPAADGAPADPLPSGMFHTVAEALTDLEAGRMIIVVDDENRENEGDLICAAQFATPPVINFMAVHGRGLICLAMEGDRLDQLRIPMMVDQNTDSNQTAFTVSIDAAPNLGVSTGISASDRSRTIQATINPMTRPEDLRRPGHIFPLRSREGGVLKRAGHTESAVDLARLAGLYPAGVICEIQNPDGSMARLDQLYAYSQEHDLKMITIADLIAYRLQHERFVAREAIANLPTEFGQFQIYAYRDTLNGADHVAIVKGDPQTFPDQEVLVRVHSECLTGDALGSLRCDCRGQLQSALKIIDHRGVGVVVYLRQEGRGIGLVNKLKAYSLQDIGLDTVEANERLGFGPDLRNYGVGAQILNDLGVRKMRLITNNPRKIAGLRGFGIEVVGRVPLVIETDDHNARYLATKAAKLGHLLPQSRLLAIGLYPHLGLGPRWSARQQAEWLDYLYKLAETLNLLILPDQRPLATAIFAGAGLVIQVGSEQAQSQDPWYETYHYAAENDETKNMAASEQRTALLTLLSKLADHSQLASLAWMVSAGHDPLANLKEDLLETPYDRSQLNALLAGAPLAWVPQAIYRLPLVAESALADEPTSGRRSA